MLICTESRSYRLKQVTPVGAKLNMILVEGRYKQLLEKAVPTACK